MLSKKPKKNINEFINAGGTAPKKEAAIQEFKRLELRVPPHIKEGIKIYAAMHGEKMIDVVTKVFLTGCEEYQNEKGFPKL